MADEIFVHPFAVRLEFLILAKPENAALTISVVINGGRHYLAYSLTISCHRICKIFFLSGRNLGEMSVDGIHRLVGKLHISKARDIITIVTKLGKILSDFLTSEIRHKIPKLSDARNKPTGSLGRSRRDKVRDSPVKSRILRKLGARVSILDCGRPQLTIDVVVIAATKLMVTDAVNSLIHSVLGQLGARSVGSLCAEHQPVCESLLLFNFRESGRICLEHDSDHGLPLDRSRLVSRPDGLGTIFIYRE